MLNIKYKEWIEAIPLNKPTVGYFKNEDDITKNSTEEIIYKYENKWSSEYVHCEECKKIILDSCNEVHHGDKVICNVCSANHFGQKQRKNI